MFQETYLQSYPKNYVQVHLGQKMLNAKDVTPHFDFI